MKAIVFLAVLALPILAQAQCNKPVDPKKVILFIDTNNSEPEIATAQKAACSRGEKLVVVPKNYQEYSRYTAAIESASRAISRCTSNCEPLQTRFNEAYQNLETFKSSQKSTRDATKEALDELKAQNAKLKTFMISGHDGGGSFGGSKGSFSRHELSTLMKDYEDINEVQSLMLLGCYTGVQKEIIEWKNIFKDARLIAGYDGSAPLSDKPLGHQYISEILLKEPQLLAQADQKRLQAYARANIKSLFQMNTAMYLSCGPEEGGSEFYYASKAKTKQFTPYDINECMKKGDEIDALAAKISLYESGELEPPTNTSSGELRQLYNQSRALEHCVEILGRGPNVNNVFNLLFYEGVKKNFGKFYESDLADVEKVLQGLTIENLEAGFNAEMAKLEEKAVAEDLLANLLKTNPEAYFTQKQQEIDALKAERERLSAANPFLLSVENGQGTPPNFEWTADRMRLYNDFMNKKYEVENKESELSYARSDKQGAILTQEARAQLFRDQIRSHQTSFNAIKQNPNALKEVWAPTSANLQNKSRKELLANVHKINGLLSVPGFPAEQKKALGWINTSVSNHLQYFQNPFSWHEHLPGNVEAPSWPIRYRDFNYENQHSGGMVGGMSSGGGFVEVEEEWDGTNE